MRGKDVILYSSSLLLILVALSSWLTAYYQSPQDVDMETFVQIQEMVEVESQKQIDPPLSYPEANAVAIDTVMAWWYPGEPACTAMLEAAQLNLDVVKPEYFVIRDGGSFEFMTEAAYGCNGYTETVASEVQMLAEDQFVMVSSASAADMDSFLRLDARTGEHVDTLVSFVVENNFTGVELDFEDFGGWTPDIYNRYKEFVTRLGNELHAERKQLMLDLPATRNETEEQWYNLRLAELEKLPVDYLVIMAYDYQYDHGVGEPVAPLDWLQEVVLFTRHRVEDESKIVIGVPSYGYAGSTRGGRLSIVTHEQAKNSPLYDLATRDSLSGEMIAAQGQNVLVYQDAESIEQKFDAIAASGIGKVSVWHLGGNQLYKTQQ